MTNKCPMLSLCHLSVICHRSVICLLFVKGGGGGGGGGGGRGGGGGGGGGASPSASSLRLPGHGSLPALLSRLSSPQRSRRFAKREQPAATRPRQPPRAPQPAPRPPALAPRLPPPSKQQSAPPTGTRSSRQPPSAGAETAAAFRVAVGASNKYKKQPWQQPPQPPGLLPQLRSMRRPKLPCVLRRRQLRKGRGKGGKEEGGGRKGKEEGEGGRRRKEEEGEGGRRKEGGRGRRKEEEGRERREGGRGRILFYIFLYCHNLRFALLCFASPRLASLRFASPRFASLCFPSLLSPPPPALYIAGTLLTNYQNIKTDVLIIYFCLSRIITVRIRRVVLNTAIRQPTQI